MNHPLRACLLACSLVLGLLGQLLWSVTGGLEHWTFESLRRAQAQRAELEAAPTLLHDSAARAFHAWGPDAGGPDLLIVDFVFTRCPGVCQSLGSTYQQMQAQLTQGAATAPEQGRIGLLSISFDTARDDAAALAAYGRAHRAQPAHWTIAVPRDANESRTLLRSLGVVVIPDGAGGYTHNAALHLVDRQGRLRAIHEHADWVQALAHAQRLARETP